MKKSQLVGILNCTPDSYFEKGRFTETQKAIDYALQLFEEGADIVDIGGESTRPSSQVAVSEQEEMARVLPVIEGIRRKSKALLSIDTFKPAVARAALNAGVNWINDITGLSHPEMREIVRESGATCCVMHLYGPPYSLPTPLYPKGIVEELHLFFRQRTEEIIEAGISPSQIILDPGIGGGAFGKSPKECLQIIKNLRQFTTLGYPLLIGLSRKSFQQKILKKQASELLSTTLALNTIALLEGAAYIRVHDVAAHRDILTLFEEMNGP
jgi:dihydropteroate synthase